MKREDFIFSIGFQGDTAIVDGKALREHKGWSARQLLDAGLYRAAFCAALYDGEQKGQQAVATAYAAKAGVAEPTIAYMKKLLGVYGVPEAVNRSNAVS